MTCFWRFLRAFRFGTQFCYFCCRSFFLVSKLNWIRTWATDLRPFFFCSIDRRQNDEIKNTRTRLHRQSQKNRSSERREKEKNSCKWKTTRNQSSTKIQFRRIVIDTSHFIPFENDWIVLAAIPLVLTLSETVEMINYCTDGCQIVITRKRNKNKRTKTRLQWNRQ